MKTSECSSKQLHPFYFTMIFFVCFTRLGISLGVAFGEIPIGMSVGPGAGLFIGMLFDRLYRKKHSQKDC